MWRNELGVVAVKDEERWMGCGLRRVVNSYELASGRCRRVRNDRASQDGVQLRGRNAAVEIIGDSGECYLQLKQPQDALREWTTTLRLDPQYAPAAEAIGQYWFEQGDYAKARRRFQQVLALTPESYSGHFQLALADERLGLLPEAREQLETACKIAPHEENCARELKALTGK